MDLFISGRRVSYTLDSMRSSLPQSEDWGTPMGCNQLESNELFYFLGTINQFLPLRYCGIRYRGSEN